MSATLYLHPRLDATARARLTRRLAGLLAEETDLRRHRLPEAAADCRLAPEGRAQGAVPAARGSVLAPPEAAALRRLYGRLVRRLHPVLAPDAPRWLWQMVERAFRDGDLAQLRACAGLAPSLPAPLPVDRLRTELESARRCLARLERAPLLAVWRQTRQPRRAHPRKAVATF